MQPARCRGTAGRSPLAVQAGGGAPSAMPPRASHPCSCPRLYGSASRPTLSTVCIDGLLHCSGLWAQDPAISMYSSSARARARTSARVLPADGCGDHRALLARPGAVPLCNATFCVPANIQHAGNTCTCLCAWLQKTPGIGARGSAQETCTYATAAQILQRLKTDRPAIAWLPTAASKRLADELNQRRARHGVHLCVEQLRRLELRRSTQRFGPCDIPKHLHPQSTQLA